MWETIQRPGGSTRTLPPPPQGLRLHDNPALLAAAANAASLYPVFVLDPRFADPAKVGANRYGFLLECLADLDASLRARRSRLIILRGDPAVVLPAAWKEWGVNRVAWEADSEPYAVARDGALMEAAKAAGVAATQHSSHTLWDPASIVSASKGKVPTTYQGFLKVAATVGPPRAPAGAAPDALPPPTGAPDEPIPSLADMPMYAGHASTTPFKGGESAGLARLAAALADPAWVAAFEKPKTDPTAAAPSTTVLSPYLKFGCVSAAEMLARVRAVLAARGGAHTQPPASLEGQLLWRDFYCAVAAGTPNYHRQASNGICRQIPWDSDPAVLAAWAEGRTGFPWRVGRGAWVARVRGRAGRAPTPAPPFPRIQDRCGHGPTARRGLDPPPRPPRRRLLPDQGAPLPVVGGGGGGV